MCRLEMKRSFGKGLPGQRHTPESCYESSQTSRRAHNHTQGWSTDRRHIWPSDIKMWEQTSFVISENSIFFCFLSIFCGGKGKQGWRTEAIFLWCSRFKILTWWNLVRTPRWFGLKALSLFLVHHAPNERIWYPLFSRLTMADLNMASWTVKKKTHANWSKQALNLSKITQRWLHNIGRVPGSTLLKTIAALPFASTRNK